MGGDGGPITYTMKNAPPGATLRSSTGYFTWTPSFYSPSSVTITVTAEDNTHGWDTEDFTISVIKKDRPISGLTVTPTSTGATVTWNQYKTDTKYVVALRDGDGDRLGVTRVTGTTHDITGLTPDTDYRVFVRTIGDGFVKSNLVFFKTKVAPSSSINTIPDITMDESERRTIPLSVTPASDSVTYAITKQDGTAAPRFAYIADVSPDRTFRDGIVLAPNRSESGQYSLRVTATIGSDTIHEDFALTVNDGTIDPPSISEITPNSITIEVPGTQPKDVKNSHLCMMADVSESSPLKYKLTESLTIHGTMTITNLLPNTDYTIRVINECEDIGLATFNVNTGSSALSFTDTINDITMAEGTARNIQINATDSDNRDITYSVEVLNDKTLPGSAKISDSTLVLEPDRTAAGEYTLRVTATAGSDTKRDEFVLTVSDPGINPPQIKTQNSTSVTIEVASEDYNTKDPTCTTAAIFKTSSGAASADLEDFESNPLTITGLSPDTAYTIRVFKSCEPDVGRLGILQFTTSSNSQTSPDNSQTSPDNSQTSPDNSQTSPDNSQTSPDNSQTLVLSRTISGNDVTLSWNDLADTAYIVAVFDGDGDRVITGGAARVSTNSYTLEDLDADTYTAFVRTPGPSGTHTMSNTVTFTITS